jgi:hypothetical protein
MVQAMKVSVLSSHGYALWGCCQLPYYTVSTVWLPFLVWSFMRAWQTKRRWVKCAKMSKLLLTKEKDFSGHTSKNFK